MKVGTTALVLDLIERGEAPQLEIAQPVDTNKSISRDQTYDWIIEMRTAIKFLRSMCNEFICALPANCGAIRRATSTMDLFRMGKCAERSRARPMSTRDRVDWSAKKFLLEALQQDEKLSWSDPWLQIDRPRYDNLDLDRGLYYELVRKGLMRRVTSEDEIKAAIFNPPIIFWRET